MGWPLRRCVTIPACDQSVDEPLITKVSHRLPETAAHRRSPCRCFHRGPALPLPSCFCKRRAEAAARAAGGAACQARSLCSSFPRPFSPREQQESSPDLAGRLTRLQAPRGLPRGPASSQDPRSGHGTALHERFPRVAERDALNSLPTEARNSVPAGTGPRGACAGGIRPLPATRGGNRRFWSAAEAF